jgi:c-di-GMP-binding flagellar brake protein YcgR
VDYQVSIIFQIKAGPMTTTPNALSKLRENRAIFLRRIGEKEWLKSRVETVMGKYITTAHPTLQGRLRSILPGEKIEIGFSVGEEYFTFLSVVLEVKRKPLPVLVLQRPSDSELVGIQRRRSQRVNSLVPLSYEVHGGPGLTTANHTLALNLSSSGLSFNAPQPISPGSFLRMGIQIPNATIEISVAGEVVSCGRVPQSPEERYKIRVKFQTLSRLNKTRIDEFVKQRLKSQKELE